jgi:uncharacterized membrane protein
MSQAIPTDLPSRSVPAGNGIAWWREAFSWLFGDMSRLLVWVGMGLAVTFLNVLLNKGSLLGMAASIVLSFLLAGGLMRAAERTGRGEAVGFGDLFGGFGPSAGALASGGLMVLLAMAALWGLLLTVGVVTVLGAIAAALSQSDPDALAAAAVGVGGLALIGLLVFLLLLIPLSLAAWLAPALIVLRGVRPLDALRLSLRASWRNLGALSVYGLAFIGLAVVASLMIMLGWLFLVPLCYLSAYAAYRDLFEEASAGATS